MEANKGLLNARKRRILNARNPNRIIFYWENWNMTRAEGAREKVVLYIFCRSDAVFG